MRTRLFLSVFFLFFCLNALSYGQLVAVGDLNGNGKPDVVLGNRSSNTVTVFINDGAGTLTATRFPAVSHQVFAVNLADFNNDGHLDILVGEISTPAPGLILEILFGDGAGNISAATPIALGSIGTDESPLAVADFNGDGFQDIAFVSGEEIGILFGDGHGGFLPPRLFTIGLEGATFGHLYVTDANLDGKPDLLAVGGNVRLGGAVCYVALNNMPAGFITGKLENGQGCTLSPDLNGDSIPDYPSQFITFFGDGQGGTLFTQLRINSIKLADGIPVDFDHNGTTDFVQAEGLAPGIRYYPGNGHGGFGDPITISTSTFNIIAIADLNGDGFPDLVLQDPLNPANISVFLNPGTTPVSIATASQTQISASAATASTAAPVTLIANVSSLNAGSPSGVGTVTFTEGSTTLGTATVDIYGNAALDFTFTAGLHNVNAAFAGVLDPAKNTLFAPSGSTSPVAVAVNPGAPPAAVPNIALATSVNPARQLNPVTFTAHVTSSAPSASSPGGTVVFKADGDVLGSAPLLGTTAQLPVDALGQVVFPTAGLHNITATYGGDATFPPATSATLVEDIRSFTAARTATSVHLTAALFPNAPSQTFVLSATVVGVSNPPSKLIYRVNGAFLALAPQNSPNPVFFAPQFQGTYTISAEYPGDAVLAPSTATTTLVVGNPNGDFSMDASPSSATIKAGQTATFTVTISPANGMNSPVTFACSGLPAASSCTFSPATVTPSGSPVSTTLTVSTTAASSAAVPFAGLRPWSFTSWSLGIVFGFFVVGMNKGGKNARRYSAVFGIIALALLVVSCGGGSPKPNPTTGTPPGAYSITVNATSGASHSAPLSITVTP
jgi:hypothetical protein